MKELRIQTNTPIYIEPPQGGVPRGVRQVVVDALGANPAVRAAWVVQKIIPLSDDQPTLLLGILFDQTLWHSFGWRRRKLLGRILQAVESRLPIGMPLDAIALNRSPRLYQAVVESGPPLIDNRLVL
jgi:hypothetical protein